MGSCWTDPLVKVCARTLSKAARCTVCKSWRSSLRTPYFWTQHQHNGLKSNKLLIKCYHQNAHSKTTYFSELSTEKSENFSVKRNIHIPYFENLKDHGQCNGLLCLHNHDDIAIWNPSTREITILPPPPMQLDPVYDVNLLNVGFDYKTNDYKVLRMFLMLVGDFDLHVGEFEGLDIYFNFSNRVITFVENMVPINGRPDMHGST
ncbi:hypothetical protein Gohar_001783 [Gossypium harknessii]|uniref:F-box associated beta-propeller type 3 domain-containing protein n=1 Tax=Gossypium harknessii TaxID=34285 RepID=A0A7J9I501_9ROSI|nr:hypothetical protein [Gossypium harknessii]